MFGILSRLQSKDSFFSVHTIVATTTAASSYHNVMEVATDYLFHNALQSMHNYLRYRQKLLLKTRK